MGIANELVTRGWYQGDYGHADGSVCLAGAVECALFGEVKSVTGSMTDPERMRTLDVIFVLMPLIGVSTPPAVAGWNDMPGRTFDEVLRVAKQADEILDGLA